MAEEARVGSEAQLSAVLDAVGEGIVTIDPEGCIVMVNKEVERIRGHSHSDLVGTNWRPSSRRNTVESTRRG